MIYKAITICLALLPGCAEITQPEQDKIEPLPSFGIYTCKHCRNKDTIFFYWNLDTSIQHMQNEYRKQRK